MQNSIISNIKIIIISSKKDANRLSKKIWMCSRVHFCVSGFQVLHCVYVPHDEHPSLYHGQIDPCARAVVNRTLAASFTITFRQRKNRHVGACRFARVQDPVRAFFTTAALGVAAVHETSS